MRSIMKRDADVVIIGAGAAGLTAAQYASRSNLSTLVVEEMASGGQALIIDRLENYPGFPDPVNGQEFSQALERQAKNFGARFVFDTVTAINKKDDLFHISLAKNSISALAVIVASGARHKTLGIPGEAEFTGRGVSYCGTCDGPLFKQKRMLVVGGGDAACDEAVYLARLTDKIIHIHRRERFRAQSSLAQRVTENDHIDVRFSTECRGIFGDGKVAGVRLEEKVTNRVYEEPVDVVFIFIGSLPRTDG
jgi:thioredoxin reductase (NADPH)